MQFVIIFILFISLIAVSVYFFYIEPRINPVKKVEQLINSNELNNAIIELKKILEENLYDFVTHKKIADLYLKLNEYDQAAIHFEKIIEINKYNYLVDKFEIEKNLANIYIRRSDIEKAFKTYLNILSTHPGDKEAIYYVAFIALGQKEFDFAQPYFEKLAKIKNNEFDVIFGAGICSYQNIKITDAINYFKKAVVLNKNSEIANLAMVLTLFEKHDYKKAADYIDRLLGIADDLNVIFLIKRLDAFLSYYLQKYNDAVKKFEYLAEFAKSNDFYDEEILTCYDLGFACVRAEQHSKAYQQWNYISEKERNYKNIDNLILILRKELDVSPNKTAFDESVADYLGDWIANSFHSGLLWKICGLESDIEIDIKNILVSKKIKIEHDNVVETKEGINRDDILEKYNKLKPDMFRLVTNRTVDKMGYRVDEIMNTYREADGVDLMTTEISSKQKTFFWVRRWQKSQVGEIPLRNFAQAVNDLNIAKGVLITTSELTDAAQQVVKRLSKITVITPEELVKYLEKVM